MSRPLFTTLEAALAITIAAFLAPQAVFAQSHASHAASEAEPASIADEPAMGHGGNGHGTLGAPIAPATGDGQTSETGQKPVGSRSSPEVVGKWKSQPVHEGETAQGAGHSHGSMAHDLRSTEKTSASPHSGHGAHASMKKGAHDDKHGQGVPGTEITSMHGMQMGRMQGGKAPSDARDPNAYANGLERQPMHGMEMADDEWFGSVSVNEFEYVDSRRGGHAQSLDMEAWYGGDYNKAWFKAEGERRGSRLESLRTEVLWDRVLATFWSTQVGIRHDAGEGRTRNWAAFGVRGLTPYWIHVDAAVYAGTHGAFAARAEATYDLLLTQQLVLQPKVEANLYSKNDASRGVGSGLSDVELGLRLRYEIRRQLAPYIGVNWKRLHGNTADYARQAGEKTSDTEYVAGVRFWF